MIEIDNRSKAYSKVYGQITIDYKDADKEKLNDLLVKLLNLKDEINMTLSKPKQKPPQSLGYKINKQKQKQNTKKQKIKKKNKNKRKNKL
ncbi:MAG: hypothetical protein U5K55_05160 [Aliarcobacter sp.]|nr:hypothetical protein [Aliarcobacter sp.]